MKIPMFENLNSNDLIKVTDPDFKEGFCILTVAELEKNLEQAYDELLREKKEAIQREVDLTKDTLKIE
tara:strand:- start:9247 stop:9450 length:204 start_codon:yes stop_codon:yes gene_type:complete